MKYSKQITPKTDSRLAAARGGREKRMGSNYLISMGCFGVSGESVWEQIKVVVAQHCQGIKSHGTVHFEVVNLMLLKLKHKHVFTFKEQ